MHKTPSAPEQQGAEVPAGSALTCVTSLQACSIGRHHPRVSSLARLSHPDLKWTSRNVTPIELHIYQIEAVLSGDEANCVLI